MITNCDQIRKSSGDGDGDGDGGGGGGGQWL